MVFANPLIHLKDEKYLPKFFELLDYSFKVLEKNDDYWSYVNYLWRIVISFVDGLKEKGSLKPLLQLEEYAGKYSTQENLNWLKAKINELRKTYVNYVGVKEITHG